MRGEDPPVPLQIAHREIARLRAELEERKVTITALIQDRIDGEKELHRLRLASYDLAGLRNRMQRAGFCLDE